MTSCFSLFITFDANNQGSHDNSMCQPQIHINYKRRLNVKIMGTGWVSDAMLKVYLRHRRNYYN